MRDDATVYITNQKTAPTKKCAQEFKVLKDTEKFGAVLTYFKNELEKGWF